MNNIIEYLEKNDFKKQLKNVVHPIGKMIYNELYIYIWFICIYLVFLLVAVSLNTYLLFICLSKIKELFVFMHKFQKIDLDYSI